MSRKLPSNRRDFLRSATLLSAAAAVPMSAILSGCANDGSGSSDGDPNSERSNAWRLLADSLKMPYVYTAATPGEWVDLVTPHVPVVGNDPMGVQVSSAHFQGAPNTRDGHYILCQFVEGLDGTIFDFVMYTRRDTEGDVSNPLLIPSSYSGQVRVYQYCTEHDLWMTTFDKA
ncbi:hypothetical protein [Haliangium sp.]|uniref:hypothetical protein n=1 Tax=Haliangium sp. TaxID=2663208 RepID=UPI003D13260F